VLATLEKRQFGANVEVDVSCEWLTFFLEDDEKLAQILRDYGSGAMLTGEVKKELITLLQAMVQEHQDKRAKVTPEVIAAYMQVRPLVF
jgi:tryptophanyl-tRNA synthetase